ARRRTYQRRRYPAGPLQSRRRGTLRESAFTTKAPQGTRIRPCGPAGRRCSRFGSRCRRGRGRRSMKRRRKVSGRLDLRCKLKMDAAAASGDPKALPTFKVIANTGRRMTAEGFLDPVVVDMTGVRWQQAKTPVLMDHDTSKRIGHTTSRNVTPQRIEAEGVVSSSMGDAKGFVEDARAGFPFQTSLGAIIEEAEFVERGHRATVNGRSEKGPLLIARKTMVREISVTVLGADSGTRASVAARGTTQEVAQMTFQQWVKAQGLDYAKLNSQTKKKLQAHYKEHLELKAT